MNLRNHFLLFILSKSLFKDSNLNSILQSKIRELVFNKQGLISVNWCLENGKTCFSSSFFWITEFLFLYFIQIQPKIGIN